MPTESAVVIVSGGMDSVTLAHDTWVDHDPLYLLSFDYGQRHKKELEFAHQCALDLKCYHRIVNISDVQTLLKGSALTDPTVAVPEGYYTDESMRATVVPNRNAIMLAIATGYAASVGAQVVVTAIHTGDHAIYPDCRPDFILAFDQMERHALGEMWKVKVRAPYISYTKAQICKLGDTIGVDYRKTWSCYKGGSKHCGKCGTCVERKEAFQLAGVSDPTEYDNA